jgi:hypothetical protein
MEDAISKVARFGFNSGNFSIHAALRSPASGKALEFMIFVTRWPFIGSTSGTRRAMTS